MKRMTKEEAQFLLSVMPKIEERAAVKERAYNPALKQCFYRLDGDANNLDPKNCCFVGYLIKPENYRVNIEGSSVIGMSSVTFREAISAPVLDSCFRDNEFNWLFSQLQSIHDNGANLDWDYAFDTWKEEAMAAIEEALK